MIDNEWTDRDGDSLGVWEWCDDLTAVVFNVKDQDGNAGVVLTRAQALELYHCLGDHLVAHNHIDAEAHPMHDVLPDATADGYDWPTTTEPASVALEAHQLVYGDRGQSYGHPRIHWTRTAIVWTGLLSDKLADGEHITPEDVGRLYIGDKLSRDVHAPKRDNRVDIAGYALCLDRLETGK